jgi:hypothetical protein
MTHRSACAFPLTLIQRHLGQALALHPVPGTDSGTLFASIDLALHLVPGTDLGTLFASIRPGVAPGAWHRFGQPVLYTWYQSLASISPPGCFPLRPLRLCERLRNPGSNQDRQKRVSRQGAKLAKDRPK